MNLAQLSLGREPQKVSKLPSQAADLAISNIEKEINLLERMKTEEPNSIKDKPKKSYQILSKPIQTNQIMQSS